MFVGLDYKSFFSEFTALYSLRKKKTFLIGPLVNINAPSSPVFKETGLTYNLKQKY